MIRLPERARPSLPTAARIGLIAGYCLALALLLGVSWFGYREGVRTSAARAAVTHTLLVLQSALELENAAIGMEASHRGYLVTGDTDMVARRDLQHLAAVAEVRAISQLVADNPLQSGRIARVGAALAHRHELMAQTSRLAEDGDITAARLNFRAHGDGSIDPIREGLRELRAEEQELLTIRNRVSTRNAARHDQVLVYGTGLAFLVLVSSGLLLLRQLVRTEQVGARLAESGARLEFTCEASRIGTWDLDLASGRLRTSARLDQVFGRSSVNMEWSWAGLLEAVHPDDRAGVDGRFREAVARGEAWGLECRLPAAGGGSPRWAWITGQAWRHVAGVPQQMLGTATDITERKRTEEELENLFRSSRDMICICSFEGRFLRVNPAWTRTLGFRPDELVDRPVIDFVHPDDIAATVRETGALNSGLETVLFENRYRTREGEWRWLLWNATPSRENRVIFAVARDITDRKQDERRIASLNAELTERSRALEESNRELEAFSYSVSHDLRAPLRHIDGYARMLIEDLGAGLAPEPQRYLRTITDSARRMGLLIDDLLSFSRLGRKPVACDPVDMKALAAEALQEVGTKAADVTWGEIPWARGDRSMLKQVWINLISNAIKYSGPRGADARISITGEALPGGGSAYTVSDNGVGFDMQYAAKLFGVFQRLHAQDKFEGTGVGLAITHRIVSRHGGSISASAEPDRGASFRFELPAAEEMA